MTTLSDRLREALADIPDATQADLARSCGIRAPSVNDWFSGKTKTLKGSSLLKAAAYLNVRHQWLADGVGPKRENVLPAGNRESRTSQSPADDLYRRFISASPEAQSIIELVLLKQNESWPKWAAPPMRSLITAALECARSLLPQEKSKAG